MVTVIVPVVAKLLLIVGLSRLFGAPPGTALRTAFYLAQAGEFALVVNTILLYVVAKLTHNLVLDCFPWAFLGALVLSVISFVLSRVEKDL